MNVSGWQDYTTAVGEQRSIELDDGSLIHLSAHSRVQTRFDDQKRDVRLVEGEALFSAQRDHNRPFRVQAPGAVIQAVGTQFNVNRRTRDTAVAVIEGAVRVSSGERSASDEGSADNAIARSAARQAGDDKHAVLLTAGSAVRITASGALLPPEPVDTQRIATWRERRLVFQADTLEDMAAEFNRYNRSPKIRIEGNEARLRRFTGVLDANHPESLLDLLAEADDLAYEKQPDELLIHARR